MSEVKFPEEYTEDDWGVVKKRKEATLKIGMVKYRVINYNKLLKRSREWKKANIDIVRKRNNELNKAKYHRDPERYKENSKVCEETKAKGAAVKSVKKSNHRNIRTRVTKKDMLRLMQEEEMRRAENFIDEALNGKRKKTIMCIVGESGAGKSLASLHLKFKCGANVLCSFTTRPPRKNEVEGRDHHFVDICPPEDTLLAYANFGNYHYYALKSQIQGPVTVYVIDESGLKMLKDKHADEYKFYSIYIRRKRVYKLASGVDLKRIERDYGRDTLGDDYYDSVFENNGTKAELFRYIEGQYENLLEEAKEYGW